MPTAFDRASLPGETARRLLSDARIGLLLVDHARLRYANPAALAMFGMDAEALSRASLADLIAPQDLGKVSEQVRRRLAGEPGQAYDVRCIRRGGGEFDARLWGQHLLLDGQDVDLISLTDVSELKDALRRAEWNASLLTRTEALCRSGSFELHGSQGLVTKSNGLRALIGESPQDESVTSIEALPWVPAEDRRAIAHAWRTAKVGQPFELQHAILCADGTSLQVLHRGVLNAGTSSSCDPVGIALLQDVTEHRRAERRILELVNFDEMTGLANRTHLLQQAEAAIEASASQAFFSGTRSFSLLSIEVPRVAELSASMGFGAGDALAMTLAARINQVRHADEIIAHLGRGEFAVLVPHSGEHDAALTSRRALEIQQAVQRPARLSTEEVFPLCRIGTADFPANASSATGLLEAAQAARLSVVSQDGIAEFEPSTNARALRELQIDTALRRALDRQELSLHYQPQVCLMTGAIVGAEALLRWNSSDWGPISPVEFIPVAERSGQIAAIGDWVLEQACRQVVAWRTAGLPPIRVGVNISPVQFQLGDMASRVRETLQRTGARPAELGVEVTESALLHDSARVADMLRDLKTLGVEISLDDFGTGFSNLSHLRNLPIDVLKIDRSFVSDVTAAPESASVTRSIIHLAHGLQIKVLAEGVETEGQLSMLVAHGCDQIQGYFFSRPIPAADLASLLAERRKLPEHLTHRKLGKRTLLLVDDEENILSALRRLFRRAGYRLLTARDGAEALALLANHQVDVIISDQRMPGMTGVEFLPRAKALCPDTIRMTLSGFTDLQSIIDAVNEGAVYKFLTKPWDDDRLLSHVAQAFAQKELADDNRRLSREVASANADLAALNRRLEQLLSRQREQAQLMQVSAGSSREMVDALPAAVFGLDPDGILAFLNQRAVELLPQAQLWLGAQPDPWMQTLIATLRSSGPAGREAGHAVLIEQRRHLAWLQALPEPGAGRGELLLLLPSLEVTPS